MNNLDILDWLFIISPQSQWLFFCHFVSIEDDRACEEIKMEPETPNLDVCSLHWGDKNED